MGDKRNLLLFFLLSALVLVGWQLLGPRIAPTANPPATVVKDGKQVALPNPAASPGAAPTPAAVRDIAAVRAESPRVAVRAPKLAGSINLHGAKIDDLTLTGYGETTEKDTKPIRLLAPAGTANAYFAQIGWAGDATQLPGADTVWTADRATLVPGRPVTLAWTNPAGVRFLIRVAVDDHYLFTIDQAVENRGAAPLALKPYALIQRSGASKDPSTWTMHVGPIGAFNGAANYDVGFPNLDGQEPGFFAKLFGNRATPGTNSFATKGGWLGFGDKYWLTAIVPPANAAVQARFSSAGAEKYQADFMGADAIVAPGARAQTTTRFFAGAKEVSTLDAYEKAGIARFDRAIDWGWFVWFEKPIFYVLDWLFKLTGNFGVAIILLTCLVRGLMFPVAQRQFRSMAGMRVIQPKMKELQARYKDDKPRLQQETMKLYQAEKVNPVAGCLPIVIQIPIFYALYKVLMLTIEMRHQPFALWIRDLSAPDPLTPINLFGLLPFNPTGYLHLGVLAILLGITMYLQFKLNPQPMDDAQKQVMGIMPWMFMFIMSPFAAGLQLYWVVSNLLTIAQQKFLYSRHPVLKQQPAK